MDKITLNGSRWNRKQRSRDCYLVFQDVNHQLFTESVLDEPTSGMDELNMMRLSKKLKRLKAAGKTVYVVTHDYEFIKECCNSVIRLA